MAHSSENLSPFRVLYTRNSVLDVSAEKGKRHLSQCQVFIAIRSAVNHNYALFPLAMLQKNKINLENYAHFAMHIKAYTLYLS